MVKKDELVHELELYDDRDEIEDGDSDDEFDDDDYGRVQLKNPERQWKKNQVKQNAFNQLLLNMPNLTKLSIGRLFYSVPYLDYLVGIDNSQLLTWIEEIVVQGETFSSRDYRQLAFRALLNLHQHCLDSSSLTMMMYCIKLMVKLVICSTFYPDSGI